MRNQTTTQKEALTVAFQEFNGVFLAKISNLKGKETYAFGSTTSKAQLNALKNYNVKFN